ncbi:hypothetical protein V492_04285 [Pseudogymnoascus sp. VKM F-4246]|nr:hypothetical protein V492_04285 [Pseudogymnoascus sp. VKM F-4246]
MHPQPPTRAPQQAASMSTEIDRNARILERQRRSREKNAEHIKKLQRRLREYESMIVKANTMIQSTARNVIEENGRIRLLLDQHGLSPGDINDDDGAEPFPVNDGKQDQYLLNIVAQYGHSTPQQQQYDGEYQQIPPPQQHYSGGYQQQQPLQQHGGYGSVPLNRTEYRPGHGGQTEILDSDKPECYTELIYPLDFRHVGHIASDEMYRIMVGPLPSGARLTSLIMSYESIISDHKTELKKPTKSNANTGTYT